jgi:hypothetical protein
VAPGFLVEASPRPSPPPPQAVRQAPEYALKAAFLYNFALFVEWPAESGTGLLRVCVLGTDPFGPILPDTLRGKAAGGRELRSAVVATREELAPCSIVFVPAAEAGSRPGLLESLAGRPVLTVGESEGFLESGGIIRLYLDGEKLRFEVSAEAARRSKLKLSSRLLELARRPGRSGAGGP